MTRERERTAYALRNYGKCPPDVVCDYKMNCPVCWEAWIYADETKTGEVSK